MRWSGSNDHPPGSRSDSLPARHLRSPTNRATASTRRPPRASGDHRPVPADQWKQDRAASAVAALQIASCATGPARGADLRERSLLRALPPAEGGAGASSIPANADRAGRIGEARRRAGRCSARPAKQPPASRAADCWSRRQAAMGAGRAVSGNREMEPSTVTFAYAHPRFSAPSPGPGFGDRRVLAARVWAEAAASLGTLGFTRRRPW